MVKSMTSSEFIFYVYITNISSSSVIIPIMCHRRCIVSLSSVTTVTWSCTDAVRNSSVCHRYYIVMFPRRCIVSQSCVMTVTWSCIDAVRNISVPASSSRYRASMRGGTASLAQRMRVQGRWMLVFILISAVIFFTKPTYLGIVLY